MYLQNILVPPYCSFQVSLKSIFTRNVTQLCEQERYTKIARLSLAQKIRLESSFAFQCYSGLALRMSGIYHKETLLLCFNACLLNILLFLRCSASWPASVLGIISSGDATAPGTWDISHPLFWWNVSLDQGYRIYPNAEIPLTLSGTD